MAQDKKTYYQRTDLKARGWTDTMIRDFASPAELDAIPGAGRRKTLGQYYYDIKWIEAIEKDKEFKDRRPKKKPARK